MQTVTSKDGTKIAYDKTGNGPAVILIEGATGSRKMGFSAGVAKLLASDFTVYCYDRRGRGDSGDTQPFAVEREIEDIDALIDEAGGAAYLCGLSSGASLALEAAIKLGDKVKKLAMYEAPYDSSEGAAAPWHEYTTQLKRALAANRRAEAVTLFLKFLSVPDEMIENMRKGPMWQSLEALAPTLAYDAAAMGEDRAVPVGRAAKVKAQTLAMDGEKSAEYMSFMGATAEALAKAIPNAQRRTVKGQGHDISAEALAPELIKFFKD